MTMPTLICHVCGQTVPARRMVAELGVVAQDGGIVAVGRNFMGVCDEHGPTMRQDIGSHATIQEAMWSKRFSKAQRARIYAALEGAEMQRFKLARRGRLWPSDDERKRWLDLAGPPDAIDTNATVHSKA